MGRSRLRLKIKSAVDEVEYYVNTAFDELISVDIIATEKDPKDITVIDIKCMQDAIIESTKLLKKLKDELY